MAASKPAEIQVGLPDQSRVTVRAGTTAREVLERWNPQAFPSYLAAVWDGAPVDLARPLLGDGRLAPLTFEDRVGRDILEHSGAHLVAKAITEAVPDALPTDGPPTEEGFYYDFAVRPLTPEDIAGAEKFIARDIQADLPFVREEIDRKSASELFSKNPYKLEYIARAAASEPISVYRTGAFVDLCRGPHVPSTRWLLGTRVLGFSAITGPSGEPTARPMQRVRGVAFPSRQELELYVARRKEAATRDHRVYGQKLELFTFNEGIPGFPFWLPNGMVVIHELERFVREHLEAAGYAEVRTPLLFPQSVYETSGHWEHYRENMFLTEVEGRTFGWKPMNCPGAMLIFGSRPRSYRELPLRLAEFAPLHRLEPSGTLHGLARVRELVQDDAHIFLTEEQVPQEITTLLAWVKEAFETFRLSWTYELSTRPTHVMGDPALWDRAESILTETLRASGVPYRISPGEGAFYGPKIDIHLKDSLGRSWQTGTIQLDFQQPRRFGLEYQGPDGALHPPAVVHRTILGTWERFFGVVLEHCGGRLPPWLAPTQARILPVTSAHQEYAEGLVRRFRGEKIRTELGPATETLSKRVRNAEVDRVPYVIVVGDQEVGSGRATLRVRGETSQRSLSSDEAIQYIAERLRNRAYDP